MNKKKKVLTVLLLLFCFIWSGAQVSVASVDSNTNGGIRFKVSDDNTSESNDDTDKPADNNSNNNSNNDSNNNLGTNTDDDGGKDLSKNSVGPLPNTKNTEKAGMLPSTGEMALRSLPIIGALVLALVIYLFIKKKKNNEN